MPRCAESAVVSSFSMRGVQARIVTLNGGIRPRIANLIDCVPHITHYAYHIPTTEDCNRWVPHGNAQVRRSA